MYCSGFYSICRCFDRSGVCQEDVLTDEQATNFYFDLHALLAEYPPQSGSQNNDPQLNQLAHYHIGGY